MMTIRALVRNGSFDFNANYEIYDCRDGRTWQEADFSMLIWKGDGDEGDIPEEILDMSVRYLTIRKNVLIIEAV